MITVTATRPKSSTGVGTRLYEIAFPDREAAEKYVEWMIAFRYQNIEIRDPR